MVNLHRKHSLEHELFCLDDFNNWSRLYDGPKVSCCIDNIYLRPKVYVIYGCCRYVIIVRTLIQLRPLHTILTSMMCIKWVGTATAMHSYDHSRPHCLSYVCGGPWTIAVPLTLELLYIIYCLAIIWAYHLSRYIYIHAYWCYIPAPPPKATESSLKQDWYFISENQPGVFLHKSFIWRLCSATG